MAFDAGGILGKLKLDTSKWNSSLSKAEMKTKGLKGAVNRSSAAIKKMKFAMIAAGAAIGAALTACIIKAAKVGDQFHKMSLRTGVTVEQLSALSYAAQISGADIETVENSLRYLTKGLNDALSGIGESKKGFDELGISVTDENGKLRGSIDIIKEVATKLADMTNETKQVAVAQQIFGARYGTKMLPLLKEGGKGITDLMEKAKELGIVLSTEDAVKAAEFTDRMTDLKAIVNKLSIDIGEELLPTFTNFSEFLIENKDTIVTSIDAIAKVIAGLAKATVESINALNKLIDWAGWDKLMNKVEDFARKRAYAAATGHLPLEAPPIKIPKPKPIPITTTGPEHLVACWKDAEKIIGEVNQRRLKLGLGIDAALKSSGEDRIKAVMDAEEKAAIKEQYFLEDIKSTIASTFTDLFTDLGNQADSLGDKLERLADRIAGMAIERGITELLDVAFAGASIAGAQSGALFTSPTIARIAEAGPERVLNAEETRAYERGVPGGDVKVFINAVDVRSFREALLRDPDAVISIVQENLERKGVLAR